MKFNGKIAGYVITRRNVYGRKSYLAWRNPVLLCESGFFWTSYEGLVKSLTYGNNNTMHTFVFTSEKQCKDVIRNFVKRYENYENNVNVNTEMVQLEYIHDDNVCYIGGAPIEDRFYS